MDEYIKYNEKRLKPFELFKIMNNKKNLNNKNLTETSLDQD